MWPAVQSAILQSGPEYSSRAVRAVRAPNVPIVGDPNDRALLDTSIRPVREIQFSRSARQSFRD